MSDQLSPSPSPAAGATGARSLADRFAALMPLLLRVSAAGLAYGLQVVLARSLGIEDYGVYAWAWAIVSIGGYGATFGLSQVAVRQLALATEAGDGAAGRRFISFSLAVVAGGATILAGLAALAGAILPQPLTSLPFLLALATIPFFALGDLAEGYARSQGWTMLALAPPYIVRQVLLLAIIAIFLLTGLEATATVALIAALLATAVTALAQTAITLARLRPLIREGGQTSDQRRRWIAECLPVMTADVAQVLRQNIDVLFVAAFATPAEVGLYFAATRIASLLGLVEFAVGAVAAHRFARIDTTATTDRLRQAVREAATITFWPTLGGTAAVIATAPWILPVFGADFSGAADLVLVLSVAAAVRGWIGPADDLLTMRGHASATLMANVASLATTLLACILLVPVSGTSGAALATLIGTCTGTLALAILADRRLGILPSPLPARLSFRT